MSTRQSTQTTPGAESALSPGERAPDFNLARSPDDSLSLGDLRGQPVVLVFYPADWSPVCGGQLALYNEILEEFQRFDARLLGISVDGVWCHKAFAEDKNLEFDLLSDFCLLYTSPSPRDKRQSRMPSSA